MAAALSMERTQAVGQLRTAFAYPTGFDLVFAVLHRRRVFQRVFSHERSVLNHWRKRLGDKLELLLAESLRVAHEAGALPGQDLKRVTVHAAIKGLNRLATSGLLALSAITKPVGRTFPLRYTVGDQARGLHRGMTELSIARNFTLYTLTLSME